MELLRRPLLKTKKSGFEDSFFVMVVLLGVILFMLILSKAWGEMKNPLEAGLRNATNDDPSFNVTATLDSTSDTLFLFDKLLPFLLVGLFGFVLIGAAVYTQHPILIFVGIIIVAVVILLGAIYSNVYHQIAESEEFAETTDSFPISDKLMENLPLILFIMFLGIVVAVIYARKGGGAAGL